MRSILLRPDPATEEALATELWQHGTVGIIEEPDGWRAFFEENPTLPVILEIFADKIIATRDEPEPDPAEFPKHDWDPILVGKRFWIAPSWIHQPTPPGRVRLAIDTPSAFGTGRHETTQLALEALEQYLIPGDTVLDIGSGSGILSHAALMLGRVEFSVAISTSTRSRLLLHRFVPAHSSALQTPFARELATSCSPTLAPKWSTPFRGNSNVSPSRTAFSW